MKKIIDQFKVFLKDKSKNLRWIVGGALGVVAGITLFLFAFINTSATRGTLINNAVTSTEQSVHLAYLYLNNYHDELVQRGSTITDELKRVASDEAAVLERMRDIYHFIFDIVYFFL